MASFRLVNSWCAATLFSLSACSTPGDLLTGQACPCIEGWFCDRTQTPNVCVVGEARDAGAGDAGASDAGSDVGVTDVGASDARDAGEWDSGGPDAGAAPPPLSTTCWSQITTCDLSTEGFSFVEVATGNFTEYEAGNAAFSPDACELLFARNDNELRTFDVFHVQRDRAGGEWGAQMPIAELNTAANEEAPSMSPDRLELFIAETRTMSDRRVSRFARDTIDGTWRESGGVATLDIPNSESYEPRLAPHGRRLYVALSIDQVQTIRVLERTDLGEDFGDYETLAFAGIPDSSATNRPSVTHDGRVLVAIQQSDRIDSSTRRAFYATRPNWNAPWGEARPLPVDVGMDGMRDIGISPDGCEVIARTTTGTAALLRFTR